MSVPIEELKETKKRELARDALCIFRAAESRQVKEVAAHQAFKTASGWHTTYQVGLKLDELNQVERWRQRRDDLKTRMQLQEQVAEHFEILKEDFENVSITSVKID